MLTNYSLRFTSSDYRRYQVIFLAKNWKWRMGWTATMQTSRLIDWGFSETKNDDSIVFRMNEWFCFVVTLSIFQQNQSFVPHTHTHTQKHTLTNTHKQWLPEWIGAAPSSDWRRPCRRHAAQLAPPPDLHRHDIGNGRHDLFHPTNIQHTTKQCWIDISTLFLSRHQRWCTLGGMGF